MTLNQWVEGEIQRLWEFRDHWRGKQLEIDQPELFPDEMNEGDWDEQYNLWESK